MDHATPPVPESVALPRGDTLTFTLPGLGGAGYLWEAAVEGGAGIVEVSVSRGQAGAPPPRRVGAAPPETVRVSARTPGRVVVRLAQRRPWEATAPPRAQHHIEIVVT